MDGVLQLDGNLQFDVPELDENGPQKIFFDLVQGGEGTGLLPFELFGELAEDSVLLFLQVGILDIGLQFGFYFHTFDSHFEG